MVQPSFYSPSPPFTGPPPSPAPPDETLQFGPGREGKDPLERIIILLQQLQAGEISHDAFRKFVGAAYKEMGSPEDAIIDVVQQMIERFPTSGAPDADTPSLFAPTRDLSEFGPGLPPGSPEGSPAGADALPGASFSPQDALAEELSRREAFGVNLSGRFGPGQGLQRRALERRFGDFEQGFLQQSAMRGAQGQNEGIGQGTFSQFLQGQPNVGTQGLRQGLRGALDPTVNTGTGLSARGGFLEGLSPHQQFGAAFPTLGISRNNPFFGAFRQTARNQFDRMLGQSQDPEGFLPLGFL